MAQFQFTVSAPASAPPTGSRGPDVSSFAGIIEWHIASAALAREAARAQPVLSGEVAGVLATWRAAERQLCNHLEAGPERARLTAETVRLRAEYQRLFRARWDADMDLRSS
ncbi:MAG TPA: hypothetical protein VIK00_02890 [Candidatus Limnocylindrales bacterium]